MALEPTNERLLELVEESYAVIRDRQHWTQGSELRKDSSGVMSYCSMGILRHHGSPEEADAAWRLFEEIHGDNIVHYNDTHPHFLVMSAWRKMIKALRDKIEPPVRRAKLDLPRVEALDLRKRTPACERPLLFSRTRRSHPRGALVNR